jgi:hypothetical protein
MRVMLNVTMNTEKSNALVESGQMGGVIQGIMENLKPEAAYFHPRNGGRSITMFLELTESAALPSVVEPFWSQLGATVEITPCMNAQELGEGLGRLG